jgi:hypothetical protein
MIIRRLLVVALAASTLSCGQAPSTTTSSPAKPSTTTSSPAEPSVTSDAEPGLRYDIGEITIIEETEAGTVISFDRYQSWDGSSGPDFNEEPTYAGSTDVQWLNQNPLIRTYPVDGDVMIFALNPDWVAEYCAGAESELDQYGPSGVVELAEMVSIPVSLTFDVEGTVVVVRDQQPC